MPNGYGVIMFTDGSIYEGQVINAQRHGYGKLTREDGTVEVGEWRESVLEPPAS